ncbi:MAG: hypothetical protein K2L41_06280 [Muribaculaceae bacterium]|nr:hypothetical protein [Muribaculaceae bacterium]
MKRIFTSLLLVFCAASVYVTADTPGIGGEIGDWGIVIDGEAYIKVVVNNAKGVAITTVGSTEAVSLADGNNTVKVPVNSPRFTIEATDGYDLKSVKLNDTELTITDNTATVECEPADVVTIDCEDINTGIDAVIADSSDAVYYNLTGNRVENPVKGRLYIKVMSGKASKIIL